MMNKANTAANYEEDIQAKLNHKANRKERITTVLPYLGIAFLIIFFIIATNGRFIEIKNIKLLLNQSFSMVIVAVGAAFIYATGGLDMAVGSVMALSALVTTMLYQQDLPLIVCLLSGIGVSVLSMSITALAWNHLHISAFIASLCVMNVASGIVLAAKAKYGKIQFTYSKSPWLDSAEIKIIVLIVMIVIGFILFNYTKFGKSLKAIGGSPRVAHVSGIKVETSRLLAYVVMGITIGIAALFAVVRGGIADTSIGAGMNLNVMTAVVLGGFPLSGGANAKFSAPIIGALMVTILTNGLGIMGYANSMGYAIKGVLLLIVVAMTYERSKGKLIN